MAQFKLDYDYVNGTYKDLISANNVFIAITGIKVLAVLFIIITWYNKFFKTLEDPGANRPPITPYDLLRGIIICVAVASYDQILMLLDSLAGSIENQYIGFEVQPKALNLSDTIVPKTDGDSSWMDSIANGAQAWLEFVQDPFILLTKIAENVFYFIDTLVYGIYLAERFFFLGLLRVFGGLAIACFAIPKLEKWFWSWLSLYVTQYLLIIPFFLVNAFTNALYNTAYNQLNPPGPIGGTVGTGIVLTAILIFIVLIKIKLFKACAPMLGKLFS